MHGARDAQGRASRSVAITLVFISKTPMTVTTFAIHMMLLENVSPSMLVLWVDVVVDVYEGVSVSVSVT